MEQKSQTSGVQGLIGPEKRYLTVRERESMKQYLETNAAITQATGENYALATEGGSPVLPPGFNVNKARLTQQAKETYKVLKDQSPIPLTAKEKDDILARKKELEKELQDNDVLETFEELHVTKRAHPAWMPAIQKATRRPKWEGKIAELRNCNQLLEPENEYADSLDYLRRKK